MPERGRHTRDAVTVHQKVRHVSLMELHPGHRLQLTLHPELIGLLVALGPRRPDGRAFRGIQHAPLDAGGVRVQAHHPAEGIDFPDHVALGKPANRRIAGHLRDRVEVLGQHGHLAAEPGGRHGGLHPGMAGANHNHIVTLGVSEHRGTRNITRHRRGSSLETRARSTWNNSLRHDPESRPRPVAGVLPSGTPAVRSGSPASRGALRIPPAPADKLRRVRSAPWYPRPPPPRETPALPPRLPHRWPPARRNWSGRRKDSRHCSRRKSDRRQPTGRHPPQISNTAHRPVRGSAKPPPPIRPIP